MRAADKATGRTHLQPTRAPGGVAVPIGAARQERPVRRQGRWRGLVAWTAVAAALVATAALVDRFGGRSPWSSVTFADVVHQLAKVRSVTYTRTFQIEGGKPQVYREQAMDPGHLRRECPDGSVIVSDFVRGQELMTLPGRKAATLTHGTQRDREHLANYIEWIQTLHKADGRFVGHKDLNGTATNVFTVDLPFDHYTVWADPQTNLPVQVEHVVSPCLDRDVRTPMIVLSLDDFREEKSGAATIMSGCALTGPGTVSQVQTSFLTGFAWGIPLDEASFRMTAPDGYQVEEIDWGDPPEDRQALIESLRFWAEMSNGAFPDDINMLLEARPKLIERFRKDGPAEQEYDRAVRMANVIVRGSYFAQTQKALDNWHYAGDGMRLGEAGKPLCWWKNEDGTTCCVVDGDLGWRNVPADQAPSYGQ